MKYLLEKRDVMLTVVNRVLGIRTFNIPPGETCPGRSVWCFDDHHGYCHHGHFVLPSVKQTLQWRLLQTKNVNLFASRMIQELSGLKDGPVRIHSVGDFYSFDYFHAWLEIVKHSPRRPFFAFTKNWRVDEWVPVLEESRRVLNFFLWFSADPSTADPHDAVGWNQCAYITGTPGAGRANCGKQMFAGMKCWECRRCFSRRARKVTFLEH